MNVREILMVQIRRQQKIRSNQAATAENQAAQPEPVQEDHKDFQEEKRARDRVP